MNELEDAAEREKMRRDVFETYVLLRALTGLHLLTMFTVVRTSLLRWYIRRMAAARSGSSSRKEQRRCVLACLMLVD